MAIFKILLFIFPLSGEDGFLVDSSLLMFVFANCSYGKESSIVLMQTCWQMADMTWLKSWQIISYVLFHSPFDMYQNLLVTYQRSYDLLQILINFICPICCCCYYYNWSKLWCLCNRHCKCLSLYWMCQGWGFINLQGEVKPFKRLCYQSRQLLIKWVAG